MKGIVEERSEIKNWTNPEGQVRKFAEVTVGGKKYTCWNPERLPAVGQEVEFEETEKNGKWKLTVGGAKAGGGSTFSGKFQVSKDESFAASYSKDIAVALINHGKISTSQEIDATILHYNDFFMKLLTKKSA